MMLDDPLGPGSADAVRMPVTWSCRTPQPRMLSLAPLVQAAGWSAAGQNPAMTGLQAFLAAARGPDSNFSGEKK